MKKLKFLKWFEVGRAVSDLPRGWMVVRGKEGRFHVGDAEGTAGANGWYLDKILARLCSTSSTWQDAVACDQRWWKANHMGDVADEDEEWEGPA